MAPPTASAPNSIGGTPRHTSTRSRPATDSVDRSMTPPAARVSGMPSTSMATSFASEPRIETEVNEPSPPRDLTKTPARALDQIGHRHHARRRLRGVDGCDEGLRHRSAHRRLIGRRRLPGSGSSARARRHANWTPTHASAQHKKAKVGDLECDRARAPPPSEGRVMGRVGRSPGSDAPLRPFPTVARQWVALATAASLHSLQSRGRLRHFTGFPFTQARMCLAWTQKFADARCESSGAPRVAWLGLWLSQRSS